MKNGIVLPSYVYNATRAALATQAFNALVSTKVDDNKPSLLLILKLSEFYYHDTGRFLENFNLEVIPDPDGIRGTEQTLAYGTQKLFDEGCDTVTWMGDDALFHPEWILQLRKLIQDKPQALAWSVYRSAYSSVHQTLAEDGDYVRVSSVCGHGMTFTKTEWKLWGVDWRSGSWISPYGDTLDMQHIYVRPQAVGERWVTAKSYVEHTGLDGLHCRPYIPEHAVNFQNA